LQLHRHLDILPGMYRYHFEASTELQYVLA
jgi:hypothetical protein